MSEWTESKLTRLRDLHAAGASYNRMADALGVSRSAIAGKCAREGLVRGRITKCSPRPRTQWSGQQIAALIDGVQRGLSWLSIEALVGHSHRACMNKAEGMGLWKPRARRLERPARPRSNLPEPESKNLSLLDLVSANVILECRHIARYDHLYCGHPTWNGSSYCEHHHGVVWKRVKPPHETQWYAKRMAAA